MAPKKVTKPTRRVHVGFRLLPATVEKLKQQFAQSDELHFSRWLAGKLDLLANGQCTCPRRSA